MKYMALWAAVRNVFGVGRVRMEGETSRASERFIYYCPQNRKM